MWSLPKVCNNLHKYPSANEFTKVIPEYIDIRGIGTARLVIQDPEDKNSVIKLAVGQGIEQNRNEIKVWEIAKKRNISDVLLPIKKYDKNGKYIKMPKVFPSPGLDKFEGPNAEEIHYKLKEKGILLHEVESVIHKNKPVAYDYGGLDNIKDGTK